MAGPGPGMAHKSGVGEWLTTKGVAWGRRWHAYFKAQPGYETGVYMDWVGASEGSAALHVACRHSATFERRDTLEQTLKRQLINHFSLSTEC